MAHAVQRDDAMMKRWQTIEMLWPSGAMYLANVENNSNYIKRADCLVRR